MTNKPFSMSCLLYVQLYKNKIYVRNLTTGQMNQVDGPFSHPRMVVSDFYTAAKLMQQAIAATMPKSLVPRGLEMVVQVMELAEGGLAHIEERTLRELCLCAGNNALDSLYWWRGFIIKGSVSVYIWQGNPLTDEELLVGALHSAQE